MLRAWAILGQELLCCHQRPRVPRKSEAHRWDLHVKHLKLGTQVITGASAMLQSHR